MLLSGHAGAHPVRCTLAGNRSTSERFFVKSVLPRYNLEEMEKQRAAHPRSTAFLLAQVGARAAALFAAHLQELGLAPVHAGTLRAIAGNAGISQQALASLLGMVPSRLVPVLDELEERGLVERRDHRQDRRVYAVHLTEKGSRGMADIGRVARGHDDAVCACLSEKERELLRSLLSRIADDQKLTPGVHPGFAQVGREPTAAGVQQDEKASSGRAKSAGRPRRP
jgi:DNA-binding MarR family transcriptional regulator